MKLLSLMSSLRPQSPERKLKWVVIRRQLQQVCEKIDEIPMHLIDAIKTYYISKISI